VILSEHAVGLGVNDDAEEKDKEETSPNQPSGSVFHVLVVQLSKDGVSQLQKTLGDSSGVLIVDKLE
jgi:hypothetical protein